MAVTNQISLSKIHLCTAEVTQKLQVSAVLFRCVYTDCFMQLRDAMNAFTVQLQLHEML